MQTVKYKVCNFQKLNEKMKWKNTKAGVVYSPKMTQTTKSYVPKPRIDNTSITAATTIKAALLKEK